MALMPAIEQGVNVPLVQTWYIPPRHDIPGDLGILTVAVYLAKNQRDEVKEKVGELIQILKEMEQTSIFVSTFRARI